MQNFYNLFRIRHPNARFSVLLFIFCLIFTIFFIFTTVNAFDGNKKYNEDTDEDEIFTPLYLSMKQKSENPSSTGLENNLSEELLYTVPQNGFCDAKIEQIKLMNSLTGEISEIPLDDYITSVVLAEIPQSYGFEAVKAQSVASRTYAVNQILSEHKKHKNADVCTDYRCCQAYINKDSFLEKYGESAADAYENARNAVNATSGIVMLYGGDVIQAFFHATSGISSYSSEEIWGERLEYLQPVKAVETDENTVGYTSKAVFSEKQLEGVFGKITSVGFGDLIEKVNKNQNGLVTSVKIGEKVYSGNKIRSLLGLRSACFDILTDAENKSVTFISKGYGHGVGMSQNGANVLSANGCDYLEILKYYYSGISFGFIN